MALAIDHAALKGYFNAGDKPSEAQFAALIDALALVDASTGTVVYKDGISYVTGQIVKTATVNIPTAQVLQLFTTPKAFGIDVPTGYYVQPISAQLKATYAGVAYATNIALEIGFAGVKTLFNGSLGFTSNTFVNLELEPDGAIVSDADLYVKVNAGNPTAGTSNIDVTITFALIPTP
jgi:hypothetical protein